MTRQLTLLGNTILIVEDEGMPPGELALVSLISARITNMRIIPNEDGSFTYSFSCEAEKVDVVKAKDVDNGMAA